MPAPYQAGKGKRGKDHGCGRVEIKERLCLPVCADWLHQVFCYSTKWDSRTTSSSNVKKRIQPCPDGSKKGGCVSTWNRHQASLCHQVLARLWLSINALARAKDIPTGVINHRLEDQKGAGPGPVVSFSTRTGRSSVTGPCQADTAHSLSLYMHWTHTPMHKYPGS